MRRPISAILFVASSVALAACSRDRVEAAGPKTARSFDVGNFSKIAVSGPYDVRIKTGGAPSVSASGPQNILDTMEVVVDGDTLKIRPKRDARSISFGKHESVVVDVSAPSIAGAAIAGSGDIEIDKVSGTDFAGDIAGSGSLGLGTVDVQNLAIKIGGSGDVRGSGKSRSAVYKIAGSGDIALDSLQTESLEVAIAGSGNVGAHASQTAKVRIMGSGDVAVTGGAKCETSKMGSGDIRCS